MEKVASPVSPFQSLHPVLQEALTGLDIQLEEELVRYRRMRTGAAQPQRRSFPTASAPVELMPIAHQGAPRSAVPIASPSGFSPSLPESGANSAPVATPKHWSSPAAENGGAIATAVPPASASPSSLNSLQAEHGLAGERGGELAIPAQLDAPQDYLESSEELLRSLAQQEAEVRAEQSFMTSLLTPLGLGSMLLLLLSSTMFGYVLMNPTSLTRLFANLHTQTGTTSPGSQPAPETAMVRPQPDLSAQNFKDLDLNTLGTLKTNPGGAVPTAPLSSPSPATNPTNPTRVSPSALSPASPGSASPTQSAAITASGSGTAAAAPRAVPPVKTYSPPNPVRTSTPSARSAPIPTFKPTAPTQRQAYRPSSPTPQPVTPPAKMDAYPYKVVTHYDSDRTLDSVRKVVPDAYVRNFSGGAHIQLGATGSAAEAEARVQQLRQQGIAAEVVKK